MVIRSGFIVIAQKLQEAADMSHNDVRARLSDAVNDAHQGTGQWASYVDHTGDGETGDCIYMCNGDMKKAPYELATVGGKLAATLHTEDATNVMPVTNYAEEADDDDHYAAMQESFKKDNLYTELPLYERFISKTERNAADESSFAGKGKSFPILKPSDVSAAVHAMGRAGSSNYGPAQLKANIIRIAKAKGFTSELPKAWRGDSSDAKESANVPRGTIETLKLNESWDWKDQVLSLIESAGAVRMPLKLIAPGKGSSAFYPAEVLKRDGPNVFTKGTHIYINHATTAEESARPEGDWHKLAGALDSNAYYDEAGKQGPGLYGTALFTSDYAPLIKEKAPFTGMSIRASGVAESGKRQDGLPVLKELTGAESVDVVTRAGAGGMILTEAARTAKETSEMTLQEAQKLIDDGIAKATAPLIESDRRRVALQEATTLLDTTSLHPEIKARVMESVNGMDIPLDKDGKLDSSKLRESIVAFAKKEGEYASKLMGGGRVTGMGAAVTPFQEAVDPETQRLAEKASRKQEKRMREATADIYTDLLGSESAAKRVAERVA